MARRPRNEEADPSELMAKMALLGAMLFVLALLGSTGFSR